MDHVDYNQCIAPVYKNGQCCRCTNVRASDRSRYCKQHLFDSHRSYAKYKKLARLIKKDFDKYYINPNNDHLKIILTPEAMRTYILAYMRLIHRISMCYAKRKMHIEKCVHPSCIDEQHTFQFTFLKRKYKKCFEVLIKLYNCV